jgi:2-dehydropantoate 2-reductase
MKIVVFGAGRIGSTLAFCLAGAGHELSVVARGERLAALRREGAIVAVDGRRAPVAALPELDPALTCDLLIVTLAEHQLAPVLPDIAASQAKTILFMFNTFKGTEPYSSMVGAGRFAFGFPNMTAFLTNQRLRFRVDGPGMMTTLSSPELVALFKDAGMPGECEPDMDAFLRSHVALAVPLFVAGLLTWQRKHDLTWAEARQLNGALAEGFELVRSLGHPLKPGNVAWLARMPSLARTGLLWAFSRSRLVKDVGEFGPLETRHLIDDMVATAPDRTRRLRALRP